MVAKEDHLERRLIDNFLRARVLQGLIVLLPLSLSGMGLIVGLLQGR